MDSKPDLDAYFARLQYGGPVAPTLEVLRALHALHPQAIAFDGLAPFLGEPVSLALPALEAKLVRGTRGGYCFEHNALFWRVLEAIGFRVSGLAGRVRLNFPDDVITPRGHMALRVQLPEGDYIADVGFGGLTLTAPLRLEIEKEQPTPHEPARIVEAPAGVKLLQTCVAGEWRTLYSFELQETFAPDYEVANWFYATHPESPFVRGVILARALPGRRLALRNARYSVHPTGGATESRMLSSVGQFRRAIEEDFGIGLPWSAPLQAKLEALIRP